MSIVEIRGLTKTYGDFTLNVPELSIEPGYVTGLIGANGAGKTTLMKCISGATLCEGAVRAPSGIGGIAPVFDESCLFEGFTVEQTGKVLSKMYPRWDRSAFDRILERFEVPTNKKVGSLSRGMSMKLQSAVAFSMGAELVMLDEATAGLDPAAREDLLDVVMDYIQDQDRAVLMSTHITTDLERIADRIILMDQGRIVMDGFKDDILESYGMARGTPEDISTLKEEAVKIRFERYSASALVRDRDSISKNFPGLAVDPASLDDILVMVRKGASE